MTDGETDDVHDPPDGEMGDDRPGEATGDDDPDGSDDA